MIETRTDDDKGRSFQSRYSSVRQLKDGDLVPTATERNPNNLTVELGQSSLGRLEWLETAIDGIVSRLVQIQEQQGAMAGMLAATRELLVDQRTIKDWYSPEDVAAILGKQPYTVREWCRFGRVNARKRPTGRGDAKEWEISHEEIERIKSHGLLPVPTKY